MSHRYLPPSIIRKGATVLVALFLAQTSFAKGVTAQSGFIQTKGSHFERDGQVYRYLGANFWYGMNLGAETSGDRARLGRELDRLAALGVTNLRIIASSEGPDSEPWRIVPSAQPSPGQARDDILQGLDYLLLQMQKRGMAAVVCLGNFWNWSGGMAQYLRWNGAGAIPYPPPQPGGDWLSFEQYTSQFYSNEGALRDARLWIERIVGRKNSLTGVRYANDPTIMAWELANEPRGMQNVQNFLNWIETTSSAIKLLDPNHLVTTGSEGETPAPELVGLDVIKDHQFASIDYVTAHLWVQNWGWYDPQYPDLYLPQAIQKMKTYLKTHLSLSQTLGKPLVLEEFGIARDGGSYDPAASVSARDQYYREVFNSVQTAMQSGTPMSGVNFWAWAGEGKPKTPGAYWKTGDAWIGDPPHEAQGWYSIYAEDQSTLKIISEFAARISHLPPRKTNVHLDSH
jgi:mannan endo-1,4-beta-mannosidase